MMSCASERRLFGVVGVIGERRLDLVAILVLDLHGVAAPDRISQVIDHLEDGEGFCDWA
jgi:hypothetical protein